MAASENRDSFGRLAYILVKFSLPLMLSGILQQLYNWADAFIVGNVVGELALAAVGSTTSMVNFYVLAITGFTLGLSILFAQKFGARELEDIRRILSTFLWVLGGIFLTLSVLGICFAEELLRLLHTTREALPLATDYLGIVLAGVPFLAVYNVYSAALRGDREQPGSLLCRSPLLGGECGPGRAVCGCLGLGRGRGGHCHRDRPGGHDGVSDRIQHHKVSHSPLPARAAVL